MPYTPSGPDIARFEQVLAAERPRLYITNSALHNPTGATLSPQTAHRLLSAAAAHDLTIVEDDIFADFEPEPSPRLAALDGLEPRHPDRQLLQDAVGFGALRLHRRAAPTGSRGWSTCRSRPISAARAPSRPSSSRSVLAGGSYRKHMDELRRVSRGARRDVARASGARHRALADAARRLLSLVPPAGRTGSADVARAALAENVVLAPGNVFSVSQTASAFMRFNVAQWATRGSGTYCGGR